MQKAQGEISVILDDDAIFEDEKCIARVVRHFAQNPNVGILAFKIIDHQNDRVDLLIPFSRRWRKKYPQLSEETRLVSYYLGCHALRREVIERCGLYQDDFMFGGEEFDLSYRVVQAGIDILYCPDVVVHHFPEPSVIGGRSGAGELYYLLRNKFWLAYKYLPLPYIITYLFVRIGDHGVVALRNGQLKEFYQAVKDGISGFKHLRRSPLDKRAIAYLKANFGRLWH
jgi:GT2 family glycosyltransferase